jgi:hypothetical protein
MFRSFQLVAEVLFFCLFDFVVEFVSENGVFMDVIFCWVLDSLFVEFVLFGYLSFDCWVAPWFPWWFWCFLVLFYRLFYCLLYAVELVIGCLCWIEVVYYIFLDGC